ncbi:MAG: hypothetical protein HN597_21235 [Desulfobacula sp.]|jgi:hypothetical protein|uniref:hypothetical protein n=1 Tax=Desulfobacula sp. TaxID=2593537 RepID=UPI0039B9C9BC|nr:hypothetical protein [Desulfobacula sp.]
MSFFKEIYKFIELSNFIQYIIGALFFLCLLLGWLVVRKFYSIWQAEVEKRKIYKELIRRYENDPEPENMENGSQVTSD